MKTYGYAWGKCYTSVNKEGQDYSLDSVTHKCEKDDDDCDRGYGYTNV